MDSLRRSFKSHGSKKQRHPSSFDDIDLEDQPILSDHRDAPPSDEVIVNVDGNSDRPNPNAASPTVWREGSYDFWPKPDAVDPKPGRGGDGFTFAKEEPQGNVVSSFLNKNLPSGFDEVGMELEMEMEDLKSHVNNNGTGNANNNNSSSNIGSKDLRVSFQDPSSENLRRRAGPATYSSSSEDDSSDPENDDNHHHHGQCERERERERDRDRDRVSRGLPPNPPNDEVLRCTSTAYARPTSGLLRVKTRSRLMDPPPMRQSVAYDGDGKPPSRTPSMTKSGILRSGLLGKVNQDDDDDDPFASEDIPEGLSGSNISVLTILQWVSLVLLLAFLVCSLTIPVLQRRTVWNLHLWKWEVLVLVLICGRLVSGWVIRIAVFFFERNFLLRKRVLYFVYGVRKAVQNCLWLGLVLLAWHYLFDKKVERETKSVALTYVTKVLFCLLVATLFGLVKTLLVKVLASSFHVSTYFDRIQEAVFNQYVIETLSGPPVIDLQNAREEEEKVFAEMQGLQNAGATIPPDLKATMFPSIKSGRVIGCSSRGTQRTSAAGKSVRFSGSVTRKDFSKQQEEGITVEHLHKLNQKNVSAWNMKRLINIVRHGTLSTLDERILHANGEDESAMQIRSEYEAKVAAKKIFNNVAKPGNKYIYLVDIMHFMREDEAIKTMNLFDGAQEKKRVSRTALKNWVINAFRERRALALTLNDTKTAVKKLHHMVNVVVGIIVFVIWLLILGIASTHILVLMSSQVLVAVFIFGNTCKTTFEAIIFLFVMHPFDVGDRCEIDGVQMIVEEMNILTTIFLRYDGLKITYPNILLSTMPIANFYRSPDMGDSIDFCIHVSTPVEKVAIMKERIKGFIESKKDHWYPSPAVVLRDIEDMNRLKVSVWLQHRMNHQNMGERWTRRELVVQEMIRTFKELDIEYRMLPLDVNLRKMPEVTSSRFPPTWSICG